MRTHFPPASPTDGSMNHYLKEHFAKQRAEDAAKAAEATQVVAKAPCDVCGLMSPCAPCLGLAALTGMDVEFVQRAVENGARFPTYNDDCGCAFCKTVREHREKETFEPNLLYVSNPIKYPDGNTTGYVLQKDQTITVEAEAGEFLLAERGALPPLEIPVRLEWLVDGMVIGEGKSCRIPDEHVGKEITYRAYRKPETPADVLSEAYREFKGY